MNRNNQDVNVYPSTTTITLSAAAYHELCAEFGQDLQAAAEATTAKLLERLVVRARQQEEPADLIRSLCMAAQRGGYFLIMARIQPQPETLPRIVAMVHVRPFTLVVS